MDLYIYKFCDDCSNACNKNRLIRVCDKKVAKAQPESAAHYARKRFKVNVKPVKDPAVEWSAMH